MYQFGHAIWLAYHNLIQGRVVDVHGAEDVFTYYERIGELEDKLGGKGFFRCHKSYVEVKNSMDKAEKFTGGFTNKGDSQEHGISLLNVGDVVHGYDGALNIVMNAVQLADPQCAFRAQGHRLSRWP